MAQARVQDQVGRVLGDRYQLSYLIGSGASGFVFLAEDSRLGRKVAVKLLQTGLAGDDAFLRRFRAEARAAAAMSHPHIMGVLDWGEEDDGPYLVLEYLSGGSLRDLLDGGHRLSVGQAARVGMEAAEGLAYAHRRGVVHRDIKPANLLFDEDGRLSIADFGLARALAEAAWTEPLGSLIGTVRYSSPEAAQGRTVDGRADVYALGLVLIEALTGTAPFAADTAVSSLMARVNSPPGIPEAAGPLRPILADMTRVDPDERRDSQAIVDALESLAAGLARPEPLALTRPKLDSAPTAPLFTPASVASDLGPGGETSSAATTTTTAARSLAAGTVTARPAPGPGPPLAAGTAGTAAGRPAPTGTSPTGTSPTGTSPTGTSPTGTSPTGPGAPATRTDRRRRWQWLALLILIVIAGAAFGARALLATPSYRIPDLGGLTPVQASAKLKPDGFHLARRARVYNPTVKPGDVASQTPPAGRLLQKGSTVQVALSKGPAPVAVPMLRNLPEATALARLKAVGLSSKPGEAYSETVPDGHVISYTPSTGLYLPGTTVDVTVSMGPKPRVVPTFAPNTSYAAAAAVLDGMGLPPAKTTAYSDTVNAGDVIGSTPGPGATVPRGTTVTLTVSLGPHLATVPDVVGDTGAAASQALGNAGFNVQVYGPDPQGGSVVLTNPPPNDTVHYGATVFVYVL